MPVYNFLRTGADVSWNSEKKKEALSKTVDLVTNDGINHGKITVAGLNAIRNNTLNTYTPINEEEKKTIESFKNTVSAPLVTSDGKIAGNMSYDSSKKIENFYNKWGNFYKNYVDDSETDTGGKKVKATSKLAGMLAQKQQNELDELVATMPEADRVAWGNYTANQKVIDDEESRKTIDPKETGKKYGVDVLKLARSEFRQFAESRGWQFSNTEPHGDFRNWHPPSGVSTEEIEDMRYLYALSENNQRGLESKKNKGGIYAVSDAILNTISFGVVDAAYENAIKSVYNYEGLNPNYYNSTSTAKLKTIEDNPIAYNVGNIAGTVVASVGVAGAVSKGLSALGWADDVATVARAATVQGITGTVRGGLTTASAGGDFGDILLSSIREGLTGAVGGAVGGKVEKVLSKVFSNSSAATAFLGKLKNYKATALGINAIGGITDATADFITDQIFVNAANYYGANLQERTGGDLITDFIVSLTLGTTMNMKNYSKAATKARVDSMVEGYAVDHAKFTQTDKADVDAYTKAGEDFIKSGENLKKRLDTTLFPGQAERVDALRNMIDTANESVKMDIDRVKKGESTEAVKPSTEQTITPKAKTVSGTAPVSTEGGVITSAAKSIDNIVNGTGTNKDYDLFKVGQVENRKAFEDATGVKLPATNSETRNFLRDFANKTPVERVLSDIPEAQRSSIIETANKIAEGTEKTSEQLVAEVKGISDNVSATIKNQFGIEVDNGRLLEINLKALADNPETIITNDFVRGYSEVIGEKLTGINPKTLENNYFGKAPLGGKLADYGNKFKTVVDSSAQTLKAEYEGMQSTKVVDDVLHTVNTEYTHMYDVDKVEQGFVDSVNSEIEQAVENIRSGNVEKVPDNIEVTKLTDKTIEDLSDFVGFDVSDYSVKIERDRLNHIEKRHGINGNHDKSLSDPQDMARMGYVINNYDDISWLRDDDGNIVFSEKYNSKNNEASPILMMTKKIDGTYCLSYVVPDSKKKTLWITSARIQKADVGSQVPNSNNAPLRQTSETPLVSSSANNNIPQKVDTVKNQYMKNDIPTYDEYKAEIEKRFPGIDEKYIQERYKGYYSESNVKSPDVKSEAKDIRVEVTNKVPAELEKTVKAVKVRSGIDIVFGNRYVDGKVDTNFRGIFDGKKIIVSENATKADIFNAVVLHELTHGIEGTKKYKGIYDYVLKEMYGDDAARLDADVKAKIAEYKKNGIELTPEKAKGEIVAENVGKYIFADDVGSIVAKNYTLGQKILDIINELIYNIKKKFGNTFELDELASAQRKYRMALDEVKRNGVKTADGKYSIETIPGTNKKYVKFGRDLELGKTKEEWSANIEKYIKDNITKNGSITIVTEDGDPIVINGRTAWKIADVQKTKDGVKVPMSDSELRVKYEAGAHIDELVEISKRSGNENEPDNGSHDWADEWNYRTAFFEDSKGDYYRLRISVGINPVESAAYNIGSIQKRGNLRDGSSSAIRDGGALNGDTSQGKVYHDKSQLSSENKTEMQLAYEKALAKSGNNEQYSFASQNDIDSAVADFEAHYGEMYRGLIDRYKTIKPGEIPQVEDVKVPKKTGKREYVSNYARTMAETRVFSDAMQGEFEQMVVDGNFSHERISNKKAERKATKEIQDDGFKNSVNKFSVLVEEGKFDKNTIAKGQLLLNIACQNRDVDMAKKLAVDLSMAATQAGQTVQAFSMLKRMSPDGQLYYLEKTVQKINKDILNKYDGRYTEVEIDSKLAEDLLNAKSQDEINEAVYAIEKSIGEQMPASKMDKWNAWRYLAMLGNTRTHFRNLFGNMGFVPARKIKDMIGATIEKAVLPKSDRTKSYTKTKESKDFAKQDFEKMSDIIKGNEGKYGTQRGIEEHRKIFETKWLEAARKFNTDALEFEDGIFLALAYKDAFAQAMTARGLTAEYLNSGTKEANADLQKIREYAINEAQKATYRDANAFSDFISGIKYRGDSKAIKAFEALTVEGVLPFKRTPANILVRGVEYSPAGLVKTILYDSFKLKSGDISASKYIDNLSSGLTGTGIAVLGAFLSHLDILVVSPDEDEDVTGYKKMMGAQNYALKFGDNTYTIDWMAPTSLPLFVGAEVYNTSKSEKGFSFKNITNAMSRITEPMFELSCLSGIQSALESIRYADEGSVVTDLVFDMATSYVAQALPTIGGQFARTIDNTQRNAHYKDRNSILDEVVESFINKSAAKIPFVSRMLPEKVDRWGRTQKYGSVAERVLENFASPGYYSKEAPTWTDSRIMTIYKNTGNKSVIPKNASKSFEVNGEMVYLSPDEYVEYSKTKGQLSYKYVTEFLKMPANVDDETKVEIISAIYEYSNAKAKEKVSDYELTAKYQKVDDAMKKGTSPAKYYYKYYTSKSKK